MAKKNLGVCVIGAGRAGMIHARNFAGRVPGAKLLGVVDALESAAKSAAEELDVPKWSVDYRDFLDDPAIDAVVVVSPTEFHKATVIDFARKGRHIFCEKPMAVDAAECDEMMAVCAEEGVKLQIGFMRRFDENFAEAKRRVDSGEIGDIVMIHSLTRGPSKPKPWMYDISKSNGILAEVNSHDIDSVRWFAGSEMKSLYAIAGNYRNREFAEQYPDYYDNIVVTGNFQNGIQFIIDGSAYTQYGYDSRIEILGTKGRIQAGRNEMSFVHSTTVGHGTSTPFVDSWRTLFRDAYLAEDTAFVNAVANNTPTLVTGHDGKMAIEIVRKGNESIREKKIVEF